MRLPFLFGFLLPILAILACVVRSARNPPANVGKQPPTPPRNRPASPGKSPIPPPHLPLRRPPPLQNRSAKGKERCKVRVKGKDDEYYRCSKSQEYNPWWTRLSFVWPQTYMDFEVTETQESQTVPVICVSLQNDTTGPLPRTVKGQNRKFRQLMKYPEVEFEAFLIAKDDYDIFLEACHKTYAAEFEAQPSFEGYYRRFEAPALTVRPGVTDLSISNDAAESFVLSLTMKKNPRATELQRKLRAKVQGRIEEAKKNAKIRGSTKRRARPPSKPRLKDRSDWIPRLTFLSVLNYSDADVEKTTEGQKIYVACVNTADGTYINPGTTAWKGDDFITYSRYRAYRLKGQYPGVTFGTQDILWDDYSTFVEKCKFNCGAEYNHPQPYDGWYRFELRPNETQLRARGGTHDHLVLPGVSDVSIPNLAAQYYIYHDLPPPQGGKRPSWLDKWFKKHGGTGGKYAGSSNRRG